MFSHHAFRKRIPEALFGDLSGRGLERFDRHRADCTRCAEEYAKAVRAVYLAGRRSRPDPGPAFWAGYWDRLESRMAEEERRHPAASPEPEKARLLSPIPRRWAMPAAAAALVVAGILVGRFVVGPNQRAVPVSPAGSSFVAPAASGTDLASRTSRYLDRSKRILLAIVNYPAGEDTDPHGLDLPGRSAASRDLVREASALKEDLGRAKERRLERLVGDLENILLQIANLENSGDMGAVDVIRAGAESRDILFKINLAELRGNHEAGGAAPKPSPSTRGRNSSTT
jgi:hypothetical protein